MNWASFILLLLTAVCVCGCQSVPVTGRKQFVILPQSYEVALGETAYRDILAEQPMSTDQTAIRLVNQIGQRIAAVAEHPDFEWEFRVIASPDQNAFCLPGGKVGVYEGLLPLCHNEAELAIVVAHEVAHALARHGGERMTHEYVTNSFGNLVNYFSKDRELATQQRIHQAYGLVSKYGVLLPYSRKHESEADEIGLILMAKAGYDPTVAPEFWERFADASGPNSPEFFSTHPSELRRAEQLREQLENASAIYNMAVYKFGYGEPVHVAGKTPTEAPTWHSNTNRALLR